MNRNARAVCTMKCGREACRKPPIRHMPAKHPTWIRNIRSSLLSPAGISRDTEEKKRTSVMGERISAEAGGCQCGCFQLSDSTFLEDSALPGKSVRVRMQAEFLAPAVHGGRILLDAGRRRVKIETENAAPEAAGPARAWARCAFPGRKTGMTIRSITNA